MCSPLLISRDATELFDDVIVAIEHNNPNLEIRLSGADARSGAAPKKSNPKIEIIPNIGSTCNRDKAHGTIPGVDDDLMRYNRRGRRF